jgi:hypothetical protein
MVLAHKEAPVEAFRAVSSGALLLQEARPSSTLSSSKVPGGGLLRADADHMPNRNLREFKMELEDALFQCGANRKDVAFHCGFRKIKSINTRGVMMKKVATWDDPVHLTAEGYAAITSLRMPPLRMPRRTSGP